MEKLYKIYVGVIVKWDVDGRFTPVKILWDDGREFEIDRVSDVRQAASLKAGGAGVRFTCWIGNKQRYLFLEDIKYEICIGARWFVEANN